MRRRWRKRAQPSKSFSPPYVLLAKAVTQSQHAARSAVAPATATCSNMSSLFSPKATCGSAPVIGVTACIAARARPASATIGVQTRHCVPRTRVSRAATLPSPIGIARSGSHGGAATSTFWRTRCSTKRAAYWRRRESLNARACLPRSTPALPEIKMQSDAAPQARRRARTAERLREALARLLRDGSRRPTVATLAREAGVGRNAIYANHRAILDELRQAAAQHGADSQGESYIDRGNEHRRVIAELKNQLRQLATQNAALLKRALDAEANAARLDRRAARLTRTIDEMRQPVPLRVTEAT